MLSDDGNWYAVYGNEILAMRDTNAEQNSGSEL
jgi:hypothetical protein